MSSQKTRCLQNLGWRGPPILGKFPSVGTGQKSRLKGPQIWISWHFWNGLTPHQLLPRFKATNNGPWDDSDPKWHPKGRAWNHGWIRSYETCILKSRRLVISQAPLQKSWKWQSASHRQVVWEEPSWSMVELETASRWHVVFPLPTHRRLARPHRMEICGAPGNLYNLLYLLGLANFARACAKQRRSW